MELSIRQVLASQHRLGFALKPITRVKKPVQRTSLFSSMIEHCRIIPARSPD
jgi:hypothetical protein